MNRNVKILSRRLYSPSLKNVSWIEDAKQHTTPLSFFSEQQPSPPWILNKAFNITVKEGDTSKLQCVAEGYPVPTVEEYTWKKDGVPRQMRERFSRFAGGSLRIDKTQFEDQGLYECTVKTSRGSATLHMYLTVLG